MSVAENEAFLSYWTKNRLKEKSSAKPFIIGLSSGLFIGISLIIVIESGWYERASMVANSKLSSMVLVLSILIISVFMAFMYRKFRWEMQEQRFLELMAAKKRRNSDIRSSQIS